MRIATIASGFAGLLLLLGAVPASADDPKESGAEAWIAEIAEEESPAETESIADLDLESPAQAIAATGDGGRLRMPESLDAASEAAIDAWRDERGWRYGTDSFFQLSRGLFQDDLHPALRYGALPLLLPFDFLALPFDLFAGLYGD